MTSEGKAFNEMLAGLNRQHGIRELKAARPIQTQKTPCKSWLDVKKGCQLKSVKKHIPIENVNAPIINKTREQDLVDEVERLLSSNPVVVGPDGVAVKLNVADRNPMDAEHQPNESQSLRFRAMHLCGGHEYHFDTYRAKCAGCIIETIKKPAIIAEGNGKRFYLRRYKNKTLQIVITSAVKDSIVTIEGIAYQKNSDLVTQYPDIPAWTGLPDQRKNPENAQVVYKNETL